MIDPATAEPTIKVSLRYACNCIDVVGLVYQLGAEEAERLVDVPCSPDLCSQCAREGLCPTRRSMPPAYQSVDFKDVAVGGPKKYRRLSAATA